MLKGFLMADDECNNIEINLATVSQECADNFNNQASQAKSIQEKSQSQFDDEIEAKRTKEEHIIDQSSQPFNTESTTIIDKSSEAPKHSPQVLQEPRCESSISRDNYVDKTFQTENIGECHAKGFESFQNNNNDSKFGSNKLNNLFEIDKMQKRIAELESSVLSMAKKSEQNDLIFRRSLEVLKHLLIEKSDLERKTAQMKCAENNITLGQFLMQRYGSSYSETWQPGRP